MTTACSSRFSSFPSCKRVIFISILALSFAAAPPTGWCDAPPPRPVLGLYAVPAESCSLVAAAGFTIVHNYRFESMTPADVADYVREARAYLDNANRWGLQVILGLPRTWSSGRQEDKLTQAVQALRDHPAIFAWYEDERAESGDLDAVRLLCKVVDREDPAHGIVLEEGKDLEPLRSLGKARMFTYYAVTAKARDRGRLIKVSERFPVQVLDRPWWPALQAYGRDLIAGDPIHDLVMPRLGEMRYTMCSALVAGARGAFFYTFLHSTRYDSTLVKAKKWPYVDAEPLPQVSPSSWEAVKTCTVELRSLFGVLAGAKRSTVVSASVPSDVESAEWSAARGILFMAANPSYSERQVSLELPAWVSRVGGMSGIGDPSIPPGRTLRLTLPGPGGIAILLEGTPRPN